MLLDKIQQLHEQIKIERETAAEELKQAVAEVKLSNRIIPICSYCKATRSNNGKWEAIEAYIMHCFDVQFSHGICPKCYVLVSEELGHTK